jgi:ferredoxin
MRRVPLGRQPPRRIRDDRDPDGLAYVKEGDDVKSEPGGASGMAIVAEGLEDAVSEAAEECPGEYIFIES